MPWVIGAWGNIFCATAGTAMAAETARMATAVMMNLDFFIALSFH